MLLDHGLSAKGHWDAEEARERHRRTTESFLARQDSQLDVFDGMPEELRESMAESMAQVEKEMFERMSSAPSSYEIPLCCAAESGNAACVRMILQAGADPTMRTNSSQTAMYHASSVEVVRVLLEAGLMIEDEDAWGWSPLVNAFGDGEDGVDTVRALIDCGADVNGTHDHGYTVFMSAVGSERHLDTLRLLVEAGADPHAVTELGYNAFHAAIDVNGEANEESSVRSTLSYLKELGVDIELRNASGQTPLARAIDEGTGIEVRVLCELGANPNAVCPMHQCGEDSCGRVEVPLLFAAADGTGVHKDEKVIALLCAGADPLAHDSEGSTPLARVVAALCADATDFEAACSSFFEGLKSLEFSADSVPEEQQRFVAETTPVLRAFVDKFAAEIPVPRTCEFDQEWRRERLNCIVSLAAHEGWARHQLSE